MKRYIGIDIGGTKCAVVVADENGIIENKLRFATESVNQTLDKIYSAVEKFGACDSIGVSCGSPLDAVKGIIQSPPNLPGWDDIHITDELTSRFGVPSLLCNDANAGALAEWRYGAGRGTENMIFLTCGTGMGAGLILNGRLYSGTCGMAGEVGHMRMEPDGPWGYGKNGSFEGFCSGGGIAQLGKFAAEKAIEEGCPASYCPTLEQLRTVNAKTIADAAVRGDETAIGVYRESGYMLGRGVAYLIDLFNPQMIVIGSIYARVGVLLEPYMNEIVSQEALAANAACCRIVPAELGESIGDMAALAVAAMADENQA